MSLSHCPLQSLALSHVLSLRGPGNEVLPFYDGVSAWQRRAEPLRGRVHYPSSSAAAESSREYLCCCMAI